MDMCIFFNTIVMDDRNDEHTFNTLCINCNLFLFNSILNLIELSLNLNSIQVTYNVINILFQMELNFHNIKFYFIFHNFIVIGNVQQFESSSLVSLGNGHREEDMVKQ
jgi:hypothetical protein